MRARYWIPLVLLAGTGIAIWQAVKFKSQPPEVSFARVTRETITSSVPTNAKVEPVESAVARAQRSGAVKEILIKDGQHVTKGQELARLDTSDAEAEREAAQSSIKQITAELQVISNGGPAPDQARLNAQIDQAKVSLNQAREERDKYQRLESQGAATKAQVVERQAKIDDLEQQIRGLNAQKASLTAPTDRASAQARLESAQSQLRLADEKIAQSVVRAPIDGEVYQFDLKQGAFLNAGDAVASIGRLDKVKVTVYVDERDLGRVKIGMPVRITWDALPGREWKGVVNKWPEQIVPLGSRQVGEVGVLIENPERELLPGTNVNAEIRAETAENALTVPKEALRNENGHEGVYLLEGDRIRWRDVKLGIDNTTRDQVLEGLMDGDAVALITDRSLKDGMQVTPVFR